MKNLLILLVSLNLVLFSFSIVQNWNLVNSAIDLLGDKQSDTITAYSKTGYGMKVELYKYFAIEDGTAVYRKYLDVYKGSDSSFTKIFNGEVDYDEIESFYHLCNNYIICPKGKFHPLLVYEDGSSGRLDVGNNWAENGDWELKCFLQPDSNYLLILSKN